MKYLLIFLIFLSFSNCQHRQQKGNSADSQATTIKRDGPLIEFTETVIDTTAIQNSELVCTLRFKNSGNKPLEISKVRTNCNCTVASYPKDPVMPGESDTVSFKLDTKNTGTFNKLGAVYSNAANHIAEDIGSSRVLIYIKWHVKPATAD